MPLVINILGGWDTLTHTCTHTNIYVRTQTSAQKQF